LKNICKIVPHLE
jgi:hypothetical protein